VIVVDTSALMSMIAQEPDSDSCMGAVTAEDNILISAGTLAEALVVAGRRNLGAEMMNLIVAIGAIVMPLTQESARRIAAAYDQWGKGVHPARLNLGDCFAYSLAKEHGCKLLYIGEDFAKTDIQSVL
jgi:ribonuclease VapC